jgi:hypothetical protein
MSQPIDPLILFIASNAIYIAIGAAFATLSNELFSFEKTTNGDVKKYNTQTAIRLRGKIVDFANFSLVVYILNLIQTSVSFLIKNIFSSYLNISFIKFFDTSIIIIFIASIAWLVINIIFIFTAYFNMRSEQFMSKDNA